LSDQTQAYRSSTLVFYCTVQHVSAVQISHHQVDVGYTHSKNIIPKKCNNKFKMNT